MHLLALTPPPEGLTGQTWTVPGSKSETNRALILGAQLPQATVLNPSPAEDSRMLVNALSQMGVNLKPTVRSIGVTPGQPTISTPVIHVGEGGTTFRFLAALAALSPGRIKLDAAPRLRERSHDGLFRVMHQLGAISPVESAESVGWPLPIKGKPLKEPAVLQFGPLSSSQFISAFALTGPLLPIGTRLSWEGNVPSAPFTNMTLAMLQSAGISWDQAPNGWTLADKQEPQNWTHTVTGDWSGASYAIAHAWASKAALSLQGLTEDGLQGDQLQLKLWEKLGVRFSWSEANLLEVNASEAITRGGWIFDFQDMPDLAPTFAVVAALCQQPSLLVGLRTLPGKESDRIAAMATELQKLGAQTEASTESLRVFPPEHLQQPAALATYDDHRLAMAFSMLCHALPGLTIEEPIVVKKSYPTFWRHLKQLGFGQDFFQN